MKRTLAMLLCVPILTGCAMAAAPVNGAWYTGVKWGGEMPNGAPGSRSGQSDCMSVLGLIAIGDASVEAAMKNGNISKVATVDHETFSILGLFASFKTKVTGD